MHIRSLELKIRKLKQIRLTFQTLETFQSGHLHFPARIRNNVTCITSKYWAIYNRYNGKIYAHQVIRAENSETKTNKIDISDIGDLSEWPPAFPCKNSKQCYLYYLKILGENDNKLGWVIFFFIYISLIIYICTDTLRLAAWPNG